MRNSRWVRLLAYVTGSVNQELLLRNEYLAAENQILRAKLPGRVRLSNPERITLAEIGKRMGRKALRDVACVARPDTILGWYRRLVAQKFDGRLVKIFKPVVRQNSIRHHTDSSSGLYSWCSPPYGTRFLCGEAGDIYIGWTRPEVL